MKQKADKMFRGCPYEKANFANCSLCPNYIRCLKKIEKIRKAEEQQRKKIAIIAICITTVALILAISSFFIALLVSKETSTMNDIRETMPQEQIVPKAKLSASGPSKAYYYKVSEEEKIMIAKLVWAEARGECYEGKVAVAAVVLNRYRFDDNEWDFENDSIESIILQKNQFASISNVTEQDLEELPDCMQAVEAACKGYDPTRATFKDGALYFYNPDKVQGEEKEKREGIKVMSIENHNFHVDFEKVY